MTGKGIAKIPAEIVAIQRGRLPTPRRINLKTTAQVRREMAYVYRQTRAGVIDSSEATRLVYILSQVGKMIEISELEARLAALENLSENPE